ncbi:MAG: hypothetical protein R2864_00755 [Syntrophotaleaceae bacterium]
MLGYRLEGVGVLAHRPLAEDLAGKQKVELAVTDHFAGDPEHHRMAVDARVKVATVTVVGVLEHFQMDIADVLDDEWNPNLAGSDSGTLGAEEGVT